MGSGGTHLLLPPGKPVKERSGFNRPGPDPGSPSAMKKFTLVKKEAKIIQVLSHYNDQAMLGVIWSSRTVN